MIGHIEAIGLPSASGTNGNGRFSRISMTRSLVRDNLVGRRRERLSECVARGPATDARRRVARQHPFAIVELEPVAQRQLPQTAHRSRRRTPPPSAGEAESCRRRRTACRRRDRRDRGSAMTAKRPGRTSTTSASGTNLMTRLPCARVIAGIARAAALPARNERRSILKSSPCADGGVVRRYLHRI